MRVLVGCGAAWAPVILSPCWLDIDAARGARGGSFEIIPNLQGQQAGVPSQMSNETADVRNCIGKINFREMKDFISQNEGPFRGGRQCTYFMGVAFRTEWPLEFAWHDAQEGPQFVVHELADTNRSACLVK